jgi:hypothetical protein
MPDVISVEFTIDDDGKQCGEIDCNAEAKFVLIETESYAAEGAEVTQKRQPIHLCFAHALETMVAFRDGDL